MTNDLPALIERIEGSGAGRETDALIVRALYDADKDMLGCVNRGSFNPTASIDDAMSLVPEGWHTHLALQDRHSLRWKWHLRGGYGVNAESRGATPALALCAAALRARLSTPDCEVI